MATRLKFLQRFKSAITDFVKTRKFTDRPGHRTNIIRQILASRSPVKQGMLTDSRVGQAKEISILRTVYLDSVMKSLKDIFVH
jgi:hypothetical protein